MHISITKQIIQDLIDKQIITLIDPDTKLPTNTEHPASQTTIQDVAHDSYTAIKDLNTHRPLVPVDI